MTGMALKLRRVEARITGRDLARAIGVAPSRVSHIERQAVVSDEAARRYVEALETLTHVRNVEDVA